jgi:hypothetical protein
MYFICCYLLQWTKHAAAMADKHCFIKYPHTKAHTPSDAHAFKDSFMQPFVEPSKQGALLLYFVPSSKSNTCNVPSTSFILIDSSRLIAVILIGGDFSSLLDDNSELWIKSNN